MEHFGKVSRKQMITLVFFFILFNSNAQPEKGTPNTPAPISGIGLLVAAGAALGGKKAYDKYKGKE